MTAKSEPQTDLFGQPLLPPAETRGRKAHVFNRELAESIALFRAMGDTVTRVAEKVGHSEKTLRKYYSRSLDDGAALVRAAVIRAQLGEALNGKSGAARLILAELAKGEASAPTPTRLRQPAKTLPLGKKAQAEADAGTAHEGTEWGELVRH